MAGPVNLNLGRTKPSSIDHNVRYIVLGYDTAGYGKVEVYDAETLKLVKTVNGSSAHKDLGRKVRIKMEKLQPSGVEIHYIYYNSVYEETRLKNRFYVGLLTIWHGE